MQKKKVRKVCWNHQENLKLSINNYKVKINK